MPTNSFLAVVLAVSSNLQKYLLVTFIYFIVYRVSGNDNETAINLGILPCIYLLFLEHLLDVRW